MTAVRDTLKIRFGGMNLELSAGGVAELVEELLPNSELRRRLLRRVADEPDLFLHWQRDAILRAGAA